MRREIERFCLFESSLFISSIFFLRLKHWDNQNSIVEEVLKFYNKVRKPERRNFYDRLQKCTGGNNAITFSKTCKCIGDSEEIGNI